MSTPDPLDQLKKLAELRDQGIVSPEEFLIKKAQLLAAVGQPPLASQDEPPSAPVGESQTPPSPVSAASEVTATPPTPLEQLSDAELAARIRPADMARAEQQWQTLDASWRAMGKSRLRLRGRRVWARLRWRENLVVQVARKTFDQGLMGRSGARAILLAAIIALFLIATVFWTLNPWVLLASAVLGAALGYLWLRHLLVYPPDSRVIEAETGLQQEAAELTERLLGTKTDSAGLAAQCKEARRTCQRFQAALRRRKHGLLTTDYRTLRDMAFVSFLAEVFENLGFSVETTKVGENQGVDLILTRAGVRIAVQATGQEGSVGNGPVRQVHTGMVFYGCQRCCVIANTTFTAAAKQLASRLGCQLLDGSRIPDLIQGKTSV